MKRFVALLLLPVFAAQGGCGALRHKALPTVAIDKAQSEIPEEYLLDVGIETFNPGLDKDEDELIEEGVFPAVRKAEARYIPVHLRDTLQKSAQWGAVRITPPNSDTTEVTVKGRVLRSDGEELEISVEVFDSAGRTWLKETYDASANDNSYAVEEVTDRDPFQNVYNEIANDMVKARDKLTPKELINLRQVSSLRFAADLAPKPFGSYIALDNEGLYFARRLPARDDPMVQRIQTLRQRDLMLIDTLNEHYGQFSKDMSDSYRSWRKFSYEELIALGEMKRAARIQQVLGAAAVIGGIAAAAVGIPAADILAPTLIIGGAAIFKRGMDRDSEAAIHADAIRELGASLDAEVSPMVVEIEGQTMELEGSAEEQYQNWRRLLRAIYSKETGFGPPPPAAPEPAPKAPTNENKPLPAITRGA